MSAARFNSICFTGSTEKGRLVAASAGRNLVPCVLELGGKSPVVIDETANLEYAAKQVVRAKFLNAG
jgi:acyl-CoA reductase-like NAD-dependent aldehyde dehydrogenase